MALISITDFGIYSHLKGYDPVTQNELYNMARELLVAPSSTDIEYTEIVALEVQSEIGIQCELCGSHTHNMNFHHKELFEDLEYYFT